MDTDEFFRLIAADNALRPGRHRVQSGLTDTELLAWSWPRRGVTLPTDLLAFMQRCNGCQLAIGEGESRGFIEMFPLRDVVYAPDRLYQGLDDCSRWPQSVVALAIDIDSEQALALDLNTGGYYEVDLIPGLEEDGLMGTQWSVALDWLCSKADIREKPRSL